MKSPDFIKERKFPSIIPSFEILFSYLYEERIQDIKEFILNPNNEVWVAVRDDGINILHYSCLINNYFLLEIIIENTKIRLGLLDKKIDRKNITKNRKILENFLNAKTEKDGYTPLHFASFRGNIKMIKLLVSSGANPFMTSKHHLNMIHKASQGNKPSVIIYFNKKYNLDLLATEKNNLNALHLAAIEGSVKSVIFLLSLGVDPNIRDKNGYTALHYAVKYNHERIIKKLLQKGADNTITDFINKKTPQEMSNYAGIQEIFNKRGFFEKLFFRPFITHKTIWSNINMIIFILIYILIFFSVFFILIPYFSFSILSVIYILVFLIVFLVFLSLSFSDPGIMKNKQYKNLLDIVENDQEIDNYCPYCLVKKTFFSLHCLICEKCIDEFDHHCFWVGNCIGKKNINLFLIFLFLMIINIILNIGIILLYFIYKAKLNNDYVISNKKFPGLILCNEKCLLYNKAVRLFLGIICFFICILFCFPLISLLKIHLYNYLQRRLIKKEELEYEKNELKKRLDEEKWQELEINNKDNV